MEFEQIRAYCLSKKSTTEETPFGPDALVYKVCGKMFALIGFDDEEGVSVNLKNTPERNIELREGYSYIIPGYHMNKGHWNTLRLVDGTDDSFILSLIDQSYDSVVAGLPKKMRETLVG